MDCTVCWTDLSDVPRTGSNPPPAKKSKNVSSTALSENVCLPCGHAFHRKCINDWFQKQNPNSTSGTCPTCRKGSYRNQFYPLYFSSSKGSSSQGQGQPNNSSSTPSSFAQRYAPFPSNSSSQSPSTNTSSSSSQTPNSTSQPSSSTPSSGSTTVNTQSSDYAESDVQLHLKLLQEDFEEMRKKLVSETERADFNQAMALSLSQALKSSSASSGSEKKPDISTKKKNNVDSSEDEGEKENSSIVVEISESSDEDIEDEDDLF